MALGGCLRFYVVVVPLAVLFGQGVVGAQRTDPKPSPGIPGVLAAFARAPIVALADVHRDEHLAQFRIDLIRDPHFARPDRDVVIEWGNARYQEVLSRYVAGDNVPLDSLRQVWRNAVGNMNGIFDSSVYEDFLTAIRERNRTLPVGRRMRALACDPPVDWRRIRTRDDFAPWVGSRDAYCVGVLERDVLARHRSALLIMGGGHLLRVGDTTQSPNVARLLDRRHPGSIFVITTRRSRDTDELTRDWTEPAFLELRGTALGRDETEAGPFETIADGYLFLRRGRDVEPNPAIYDEPAYRQELDRRWCIVQGHPFPTTTSARTARPPATGCR
jgi:hypothetical protein